MLIIPAIDILDGKVVRLTKGDFADVKYYNDSPLKQAGIFASYGFKWLHMVDLKGSKEGFTTSISLIEEIKKQYGFKIEFGGGIRDYDTAELMIKGGVDKLIIGSLSVKNRPEFEKIAAAFPDNIIVASDTKEGFIAAEGWEEKTAVRLMDHIRYCQTLGIDTFLCTDIAKDGMLQGPNLGLYGELQAEFPEIKIIASGGIKDIQDIKDLMELELYATVVGKAIYENKIDLKELKQIGM